MGHLVLGAPPVARYHLHERLLRALRQRGHRVSLLPLAPAEATFWRHQGEYLARLPATGAREVVANWPFDDLAPARRRGRRRRFADRAAALAAWLAAERPDLMVLHQRRDDDAALLHFAARAHGCRTLWFGDGLLPHTLQCDERGLDGDAAAAARRADDFRVVRPDRELLAACLTHALAQAAPFALPRAAIHVPPLGERLRDAMATAQADGPGAGWASLRAFADALPPTPTKAAAWRLPASPFLTVLLQSADDPRVARDAVHPPTASEFVAAATVASRSLGCDGRLAVVAAEAPAGRRVAGHALLPTRAAALAAATGLAVATINHPMASVALLAGTPVVHLGRALYGMCGVANAAADVGDLGGELARALAHDHPALRARAMTWLFTHGHVWCSATAPDHNGIVGMVMAIEARLPGAGARQALRHRHGPPWPLAPARPSPQGDCAT
ncbi:MAG: hypothetical protein FJ306_00360 [Planctomycetes bacterium]|nr:hypothetical protein [Planctomycetota bacterium]